MKQLNDLIADFWADYAAVVLLGGGLLGVIALIGLFIWAKKSQKPLRPVALAFSMNLALLLNAEGMWVIAVDQLKLPKIFAVLVFAVFEICFLTATSLAAEQYRRTTVYGPDGKILTPGHPGPMLYIAALIAAISGIIVASNAVTGTEKLLRLAVPCVIFLMWWAALTAAGQRVRRGRFAYSPRRMAERWGWLIPDDDPDLVRMASERQVRRMVVNYHRVSGNRWPRAWWKSRLLKDARTAGEPVVADVIQQLARIQRVMDLLVPGGLQVAAPVVPQEDAAALLAQPAPGSRRDDLPEGPGGPGRPVPGPVSPAAPQVQFVQPVVADAPDDLVTEALAEALAAQRGGSVGVPIPRRAAEDVPEGPATVPVAATVVRGPTVPAVSGPVDGYDRPAGYGYDRGPIPPAVNGNGNGAAPIAPVAAENGAAPVSPAPAIPAWAAIGTGARPAVSIVGSPWWRLAVDRLSKQVAEEISVEDLPDMTYPRITELARNLAARNTELGEGVVKAFVNDYIRELNGEYGEVAYPWRDFLPPPATAAPGSGAWQAALEELRTALEEELSQGVPADPYELTELLLPSAPRLDEETIRTFIGDYLLALSGQAGSGSNQPWQHLLPRPQSARSATDEEILGAYGGQLEEYLAANGRITRNRVQSITGIKSRLQADRIKAILEERAGVPIS
ncbi:MFS transporter [Actinoplanes sp. OR16]|uniref:MFS transporter n=1 Tax=Actinoplanes sp. OR16 TaxID=946334 RepID=UPI000FD888CC|nr:MFS transporter [Actinoplanes sp. OR16]